MVERERLAHEYLSLWLTMKMVTEITKMFHEIAMVFPEYASIEQLRMT